jgi:hypothetical protein
MLPSFLDPESDDFDEDALLDYGEALDILEEQGLLFEEMNEREDDRDDDSAWSADIPDEDGGEEGLLGHL